MRRLSANRLYTNLRGTPEPTGRAAPQKVEPKKPAPKKPVPKRTVPKPVSNPAPKNFTARAQERPADAPTGTAPERKPAPKKQINPSVQHVPPKPPVQTRRDPDRARGRGGRRAPTIQQRTADPARVATAAPDSVRDDLLAQEDLAVNHRDYRSFGTTDPGRGQYNGNRRRRAIEAERNRRAAPPVVKQPTQITPPPGKGPIAPTPEPKDPRSSDDRGAELDTPTDHQVEDIPEIDYEQPAEDVLDDIDAADSIRDKNLNKTAGSLGDMPDDLVDANSARTIEDAVLAAKKRKAAWEFAKYRQVNWSPSRASLDERRTPATNVGRGQAIRGRRGNRIFEMLRGRGRGGVNSIQDIQDIRTLARGRTVGGGRR